MTVNVGDDSVWWNDPVDIVRHFSNKIKNGRTYLDATRHAEGELVELYEEIQKVATGQPEGSDGIVGEAIDIIACLLDVIFLKQPDITNDEITAIMLRKCQKWAKFYASSVEKRESPTAAGQKVKVRDECLDMTELSLGEIYFVESVTTYDWQVHQPSKVRIVGVSEAIYSADTFYVVER